jgi:hypothetical protein
VTGLDLIALAEQDADAVSDDAADAGWDVWEKAAVESLWKLLVSNFRDLYYSTFNFSLTGTASGSILDVSVSVPTMRTLLGIDLNPDTNLRRRVPSRPFVNRNDGAFAPYTSFWTDVPWAADREYMLQGRKLIVAPYERASGNYRLHYRPGPTIPTDRNTVLDVEMEPYSEYLASFMARRALAKEESDTSVVDARLLEIKQEIMEAGVRNDDAGAIAIADTEFWLI